MRTAAEKDELARQMRAKYGKPGVPWNQQHYRVGQVAKMLGIGVSTVERMIRGNPLLRFLPRTPGGGKKRRTPLISEALLQELYDRMAE
jgi:transposase